MSCCQEPTGRNYLLRLLARREDIAVYPGDALDNDEPPEDFYFYRPGELMVPNDPEQVELFERVAAELNLQYCRCATDPPAPRPGPDAAPGTLETAPPRARVPAPARFFVRTRSPLEVVLRRLEGASHRKLMVTPNHVLFGCPVWGMDPHGDPGLPAEGEEIGVRGGGDGVTVAVVDTGVPDGYWENPVLGPVATSPSEMEPWSYSGPHPVLVYPQGHGSFVAGVVRQVASRAKVQSYRALDTDGATDEWSLGNQLSLVLAAAPQVVNLSLGAPTRADQALMGLAALAAAASQEGHDDGPIVVAAAGNMGDRRPFFPAADRWAIGVGAVQLTGASHPVPASFSNFGSWVDVCAPGVDVLSSYEAKPYRPLSAPSTIVDFRGLARWSGTSFAAPYVSGVIAEVLATQPGLGREGALAQLVLRPGAVKVPNLGWYVP